MSLVLAEHFYSIKLFFKYQICLAIKKELDINQVLFHFIQYLDIAQVKMVNHLLNRCFYWEYFDSVVVFAHY